ncbi:hypothetical protein ABI214_19055 [Prescottella soli]|uniref:Uncharacterized protein n=1 Tax=Prescottella soli TaxID=1543852 RepID=A0ABW9FYY7_9NOCA
MTSSRQADGVMRLPPFDHRAELVQEGPDMVRGAVIVERATGVPVLAG